MYLHRAFSVQFALLRHPTFCRCHRGWQLCRDRGEVAVFRSDLTDESQKMQQSLSQTESLLRDLLLQHVDKDTFAIIQQRPSPGTIPPDQVLVACGVRDEEVSSRHSHRGLH